jgi:hypothetical protein
MRTALGCYRVGKFGHKAAGSVFARLATTAAGVATEPKGPTAMVFLNMGGPSRTEDVEDFLTRLFVSSQASVHESQWLIVARHAG